MSSTNRKMGPLLKGNAVYQVDNKSRVFCSYCKRDFLVTCLGTHMNTQCKEGIKAMGKNPDDVQNRRKEVRNQKNRENSKNYENRLKINMSNWERDYQKKKPKKQFDSKFLKVKSYNPFYLKESEVEVQKESDMQILFDALIEAKLKQNAEMVKLYFEGSSQTRKKMSDWKQMKSLTKKMIGPRLQSVLHPDKLKE